jgi:hypothetical protein
MGGRLVSRFVQRATERLDLGGGDWVDLRTRITFGERNLIQAKALGPPPLDSEGRIDPSKRELDLGAANVELMRLVIATWGGPGFCSQEHPHEGECQPKPITAENIVELDETAEKILTEIGRRLMTRSPDFTSPPSPRPGVDADSSSTADASPVSSSAASSDGAGTSLATPTRTL